MIVLEAAGGVALAIDARGATWVSCQVPVRAKRRDVILRRAIGDRQSFLGSTIGRYANRIAHGLIRRGEREWQLALQEGSIHHLHGGPGGFHACLWQAQQASATRARFTLRSPEGDQGYPGELLVEVVYELADAMTIEMRSRATASAPTPVAITNHAYFNLDGSPGDVRGHTLRVNASRYMPVDRRLIPFGPPSPVTGTSFDFREAKPIARDWLVDPQQQQAGGYDHAFLLDGSLACELTSTAGDLRLAITTSLPALQVYSGQGIGGTEAPDGGTYRACAGVALEPGFLPDSPNHPEWPQPGCWLLPGDVQEHVIRYSFA